MSPIFAALFFTIVASVAANSESILPPYFLPPQVTACGPNGRWTGCASACEPKCSSYKMNRLCLEVCVEGCKCNKGYVMDDETGLCILPEFCNKILVKKPHTITPPGLENSV